MEIISIFSLIALIFWLNVCLYFKFSSILKNTVMLLLLLGITFWVVFATGYFSAVYLLGSMVLIALGIIALYTNRIYIYLMALFMLLVTPVFLAFKLNQFAEILSVNAYYLLVVGVVKDLLHDKVFYS